MHFPEVSLVLWYHFLNLYYFFLKADVLINILYLNFFLNIRIYLDYYFFFLIPFFTEKVIYLWENVCMKAHHQLSISLQNKSWIPLKIRHNCED